MPLSRLFVSLLLSEQAVTPFPWLSKGHAYKCTNTWTRADTFVCSIPSGMTREVGSREAAKPTDLIALLMGVEGQMFTSCVLELCVCVCDGVWMKLTEMRQNVKDESTKCVPLHLLVFLLVCHVSVCPLSHCAANGSSSLCLSVCIILFPPSLTPYGAMPQLDKSAAFGILKKMSQQVTSETDT